MRHRHHPVSFALLAAIIFNLFLGILPGASLAPTLAAPNAAERVDSTRAPAAPAEITEIRWAQSVDGHERTVVLVWQGTVFEKPPAAVWLPLMLGRSRRPIPSAGSLGGNKVAAAPLAQTAPAAGVAGIAPGYSVFRRVAGETEWILVGTVSPAEGYEAMEAILGEDLTAQLRWDLRPEGTNRALTSARLLEVLLSTNPKVEIYSQQFYQVAQVRGMAFVDSTARPGLDLEYGVGEGDETSPSSVFIGVKD
ncbi:MAG TPA: hypothetical protein VM537_02955, partial [Anaerolineae bacterium]|nr:hypothetical protein [Anaerolineae bacterium]